MGAMDAFAAKHADKIRGTLSCFDRVLFRGYLPIMSGFAMAEFLKIKGVSRLTLKPFLLAQAERLKKQALAMVGEAGRPHQYLTAPTKKGEVARRIAERDGIAEGLVCVFAVDQGAASLVAELLVETARRRTPATHSSALATRVPPLARGPVSRSHPRRAPDDRSRVSLGRDERVDAGRDLAGRRAGL